MKFDFHYLLEYFIFGFTGGGELPTLIQFFALASSVIILLIAAISAKTKRN